jgi:hypothetical protein
MTARVEAAAEVLHVFPGVGSSPRSLAATVLLLLASFAARGEATSIVIATGELGMRKEIRHSLGIDVQVRSAWRWHVIRPVAGVLTSSKGGAYVYSGVVADIPLAGTLHLTPGFAPGIVLASGNRDLGSPIEFRSSLEVSFVPVEPLRFGIALSHVSNGRLGQHNPGLETLTFNVSIPLGR